MSNYDFKGNEENFDKNPQTDEIVDGKCIRSSGSEAIYFVIEQKKCLIPNKNTFNLIFKNGDKIVEVGKSVIDRFPTGESFADGARVFRKESADPNASWYLLHNNTKCHILSMDCVKFCNFQTPEKFPDAIVSAIPNGVKINYGV